MNSNSGHITTKRLVPLPPQPAQQQEDVCPYSFDTEQQTDTVTLLRTNNRKNLNANGPMFFDFVFTPALCLNDLDPYSLVLQIIAHLCEESLKDKGVIRHKRRLH